MTSQSAASQTASNSNLETTKPDTCNAVRRTPVSNAGTSDYETFFLNGKDFGQVHWLRTESGGDGVLLAGFWSHAPADLPYEFTGDETVYVLEGEVTVDVNGGDSVTLRRGDVASFTKGQTATWHITKAFKKFFVVSG